MMHNNLELPPLCQDFKLYVSDINPQSLEKALLYFVQFLKKKEKINCIFILERNRSNFINSH
jgi:hypothetical protein